MNLHSRRALVWLLALVLLGLNDHVLKSAAVLPPVITGKLSDFAGLVVAPALLVRLVDGCAPRLYRRFSRGIRGAALLLVGLIFCTINLVPDASNHLVATMNRIGMSWMLWPDPTDLIALTVLPLAFWVSEGSSQPQQRAVDSALLFASAVLCVATGQIPEDGSLGFLINRTSGAVNVRTATLDGEMQCHSERLLLEDNVLRSEDFVTGGTSALAAGEAVKLAGGDFPCRPVRLMVWETGKEDEAVSVVIGFGRETRSLADPYRNKDLKDRTNLAVIVKGREGLRVDLGPGLRALQLAQGPTPTPSSECAFPSYTTLSSTVGEIEITKIEQISDRCTAYRGRAPDDGSSGGGGANGQGGRSPGEGDGGMGGGGETASEPFGSLTICTDHELPLEVGGVASVEIVGTSEVDSAVYRVTWNNVWDSMVQAETTWYYSSEHEDPRCPQVRHDCGGVFVRTPPSWERRDPSGFEAGWSTIVSKPICPRELQQPRHLARWVSIR